jgi:uncharacterized membrane protein
MTGAGLIGLAGALLSLVSLAPAASPVVLVIAGLLGGTAGMLVDSFLGATVQASYWCPQCGKPTESRVHRCGTRTELRHGLAWVNNDLVNVAGTAVGAIAGGIVAAVL